MGVDPPISMLHICGTSKVLAKLGLDALTANLFVFWFALLSTITPPVCGTVFIAAGMVGENWLKVAVAAMALGVGLYTIPFAMIANPALIGLAHTPAAALLIFVKLAIGLAAISYGIIADKLPWKRVTLVIVGLVLVFIG